MPETTKKLFRNAGRMAARQIDTKLRAEIRTFLTDATAAEKLFLAEAMCWRSAGLPTAPDEIAIASAMMEAASGQDLVIVGREHFETMASRLAELEEITRKVRPIRAA